MKGLVYLAYVENLSELRLFILEQKRLRWDLTNAYRYLKGKYKEGGAWLFSVAPSARTRGSEHKPEPRGSLWALLCCAVLADWHRLPGDCGVSSLEMFRSHGPGPPTLGVPAGAGGGGQKGTEGPANLSCSGILWYSGRKILRFANKLFMDTTQMWRDEYQDSHLKNSISISQSGLTMEPNKNASQKLQAMQKLCENPSSLRWAPVCHQAQPQIPLIQLLTICSFCAWTQSAYCKYTYIQYCISAEIQGISGACFRKHINSIS